jgi:putative FmdB family regulatory protein
LSVPTYDYRCTKCGHRFEVFHGIKDESVRRCPRCKAKAVRVPAGGAGILFKGSGFYITDYRSKTYRERAKQEGGGSGGGGGATGGGGGEGGAAGRGGAGSSAKGGSKGAGGGSRPEA